MVDDPNKIELGDDFSLDDIEDLPEFVKLPTGGYLVSLDKGIEVKEINDSQYYDVPLTVLEVIEVDPKALDDGENMPKRGDVTNMIFKRDNKFGMGNFKKFFSSHREKFGVKTFSELAQAAKGTEMMLVVKRTYNKDRDQHNVKVIRSSVT